MATSSLPSVSPNPFDSLQHSDRIMVSVALASYEAVLKRRVNAERNERIRSIIETDLLKVRVLLSNCSES